MPHPDDGTSQPWHFALAVYAQPGSASVCLDLQDRRGVNIVLALFALWAGAACAVRLNPAQLSSLLSLAEPWAAEIVGPLRAIRRRLKAGPPPAPGTASAALRRHLQDIEIEAERIELESLHELFPLARAGHPDAAAARANLEILCPPRNAADHVAIGLLVEAALAAAA